jgi:aconitate hydratase
MRRYLSATGRQDVVDAADKVASYLTDPEVYANQSYFDQVIEINLSELEPHINGPLLRIEVFQNEEGSRCKWLANKSRMGTNWLCTNSSYEDMARAVSIVNQAVEHGITLKQNLVLILVLSKSDMKETE